MPCPKVVHTRVPGMSHAQMSFKILKWAFFFFLDYLGAPSVPGGSLEEGYKGIMMTDSTGGSVFNPSPAIGAGSGSQRWRDGFSLTATSPSSQHFHSQGRAGFVILTQARVLWLVLLTQTRVTWEREPQLRNCSNGHVLGAFSWLTIDMKGPSLQPTVGMAIHWHVYMYSWLV